MVAKREQTFSTLAKKEGKGASQRAKTESKAGLKESAKDSRWEIKVDKAFAAIRNKRANQAKEKLHATK
jgi:hypothetical protein